MASKKHEMTLYEVIEKLTTDILILTKTESEANTNIN